jgi:hypothetical protein
LLYFSNLLPKNAYISTSTLISGIENIGDVEIIKRKDGTYLIKIKSVDSTIIDYINGYYDILVKRIPLYNIAEVIKREGFKK